MSRVFLSPATFVGGSLVGAFLLAAWLGAFKSDEPPAPHPAPMQRVLLPDASDASPSPAAQRLDAVTPQPQAPAQGQVQSVSLATGCPSAALTAPRGAGDGRFALESALNAGAQVEPSAFLAVARESAQHGRMRDAEVALLAACHVAERASGGQSLAVADLKSQMARQYAALAASAGGQERQELMKRTATLLSESAITYSASLGRNAPKTRHAEQLLASLREPGAVQRTWVEARAPDDTRVMGAAPRSAEEARGPRSSGSASRLISSDPELAQLERDMERLHAQASRVTRDPAGLRRRDGQLLAQRDDACHDKACLLRWYAQRRTQLLDEF